MLQQQRLPLLLQQDSAEGLYFRQDRTLFPCATLVQAWLDDSLPGRWVGRQGPLEWPPHLPDLTSFDVCFVGHSERQNLHSKASF